MTGEVSAQKALPALLATQVMAAEVYAYYLYVSSDDDRWLWKKMLSDELDHARFIHGLIATERFEHMTFPVINVTRTREISESARRNGDMFLMRLEGALRLECAELNYGLEGWVARHLEDTAEISVYADDVKRHVGDLLDAAKRYSASPNIKLQATRLADLFETSLYAADVPEEKGTRKV